MASPIPKRELLCPLCSQPNACAVAACGSFDVDCWCAQTQFSAALLARVPQKQQGAACICPDCAKVAQAAPV